MLGLLVIVATLGAAALDETVTDRVLAGARLSQQRAFLAASSGLNVGLEAMENGTQAPASITPALPARSGQVRVDIILTRENPVPAGFTAGRFIERSYEIRSAGQSTRQATSIQVQGIRRIEPTPAPAATDAP